MKRNEVAKVDGVPVRVSALSEVPGSFYALDAVVYKRTGAGPSLVSHQSARHDGLATFVGLVFIGPFSSKETSREL